MKKLAIIGAGHLGQQIAHIALNDAHCDEVVFFDDFSDATKDHRILGKTEEIEMYYRDGAFNTLSIGIGYKHISKRAEFFDMLKDKIPFETIIHSSCWVDETAHIGAGSVIYPNCCVDANVRVGLNTIVNISSSIAHDSNIGNHCFLSPSVAIAGFVNIKDQCIIGINATVIDHVEIAPEIQLGGATVVIEDLTRKGLYVGSPARFIR